jgi:hypothetical protein
MIFLQFNKNVLIVQIKMLSVAPQAATRKRYGASSLITRRDMKIIKHLLKVFHSFRSLNFLQLVGVQIMDINDEKFYQFSHSVKQYSLLNSR